MIGSVKAAGCIPAGEAVVFRAFFSLPVIVAWLAARGRFRAGPRVPPLPEVAAIRFAAPIPGERIQAALAGLVGAMVVT